MFQLRLVYDVYYETVVVVVVVQWKKVVAVVVQSPLIRRTGTMGAPFVIAFFFSVLIGAEEKKSNFN